MLMQEFSDQISDPGSVFVGNTDVHIIHVFFNAGLPCYVKRLIFAKSLVRHWDWKRDC